MNEAARLCEMAKQRPERLLASGAAVERAGGEEAGRWSLGEPIVLRGRDEATRLATVAYVDPGGEREAGAGAGQQLGVGSRQPWQRRDLDAGQPLDGVAVRAFHHRRSLWPGRQHDSHDRQADGVRGLHGQQRVVDRAQTGPRGNDERQRQLARQVSHEEPERQGHEQSSDSLDDENLGVRRGRTRRGDQVGRLDRRPGQLGRQVRRHGRLERERGDLGRLGARRPSQQLVVGLARLLDARHHRLPRRDPLAARPQRRAHRRRHDGLADAGVGAGDEHPAHGVLRGDPLVRLAVEEDGLGGDR